MVIQYSMYSESGDGTDDDDSVYVVVTTERGRRWVFKRRTGSSE